MSKTFNNENFDSSYKLTTQLEMERKLYELKI